MTKISMKFFLFLGFICSWNVAAAEEVNKSNFHFLDMHCSESHEADFEASPQSPPLDVDDPGTPGCNRWEINILVNGELTKEEKAWQLPLLDANYGIGNNLQLKYEVPYSQIQTKDNSTTAVGNSKFGIKGSFFENEASKLQIGFYPQVEIFRVSTTRPDATSGHIINFPILLSKKVGDTANGEILMTANLAFNASAKSDTSSFASAAVGIGFPVFHQTALMGEVSTEQAIKQNVELVRDQLIKANIGFLSSVSKHIQIYGSIGRSIYASDEINHSYVLTGVRLLADNFSF